MQPKKMTCTCSKSKYSLALPALSNDYISNSSNIEALKSVAAIQKKNSVNEFLRHNLENYKPKEGKIFGTCIRA